MEKEQPAITESAEPKTNRQLLQTAIANCLNSLDPCTVGRKYRETTMRTPIENGTISYLVHQEMNGTMITRTVMITKRETLTRKKLLRKEEYETVGNVTITLTPFSSRVNELFREDSDPFLATLADKINEGIGIETVRREKEANAKKEQRETSAKYEAKQEELTEQLNTFFS